MIGELLWAVKTSLLGYVAAQADGTIEVTGGAERSDDRRFRFPLVPQPGEPTGTLMFRGGIRLHAHGGLMDVTLEDPWISTGAESTVSVLATTGGEDPERIVLARFALLPDGEHAWRGERVRLTSDGAFALGGLQYHEHQQVDDLAFSAPAGDAPDTTHLTEKSSR
ncbi:HtaA domain-containing protein [Microbacterium sp. CPCC 204701]|uniref:HtaA domain-containing protein n=1 Tax=Microbacterium sp. CPCC 204701 TaxID=2493084 RepID=UPI000FDA12B6|nr:HtaA domain-containing protein [Microbacterium sp. CPCC 204701]